ncbi:MAG: DNA-protecting protein DprA [Proteobacteria bacterium]|nr:DNA-protecting protein DprA [Pseudomonadota bacterium]
MAKRGEPESDDFFTPAPLPIAPLDDAQRLACLRLIRSENVGPVTFRELINHFGGAQPALDALPEVARRAARRRPIRICPADRAEAELEAAARHGSRALFTIEPDYPAALAHLAVPPPLLYAKGQTALLARDALAVVGSRNASAAGTAMARLIASRVGEAGYVIASGLARGIDRAAHEASLATGTVAVLAGGIDFVYPPENASLYAEIAEKGCLVTEMPPGFVPRGQDFPRRNRIISGLALGVVVIEAARRSGSLITADAANDQGRLVMAVPGHPLDPRSEGPNALLKQPGVVLVTSPNDILEALAPMRGRSARNTSDFAEGSHPTSLADEPATDLAAESPPNAEDAILAALGSAPTTLDEIVRATRLAPHAVRAALLELSLAGRVEHNGAGLISRRPDPE